MADLLCKPGGVSTKKMRLYKCPGGPSHRDCVHLRGSCQGSDGATNEGFKADLFQEVL